MHRKAKQDYSLSIDISILLTVFLLCNQESLPRPPEPVCRTTPGADRVPEAGGRAGGSGVCVSCVCVCCAAPAGGAVI